MMTTLWLCVTGLASNLETGRAENQVLGLLKFSVTVGKDIILA